MSSRTEIPRYEENPVYIFFEYFILKELGLLTEEQEDWVKSLNLQKIFKTNATDWQSVVKEFLHLSETIEVAVWDLWIRNKDCYFESPEGYEAFAQDITDNYMKEDSKVDVWEPESYQRAVKKIDNYKRESDK